MIAVLSVITNFGCDTGCKYCIWRNHVLSQYKTTYENMDWTYLKSEILHTSKDRISISGGGDPLYQYELNDKWWNTMFAICKVTNTKIDLHTSKMLKDADIIKKFNKYVLHINYNIYKNNQEYIEWLSKKIKLRVVFVVTNDLSEFKIYEIEKFCKRINIQLSFRQLVVNNKSQRILEDVLGKQGTYWKYIKQADYNVYFMPNNKIYKEYLITEE